MTKILEESYKKVKDTIKEGLNGIPTLFDKPLISLQHKYILRKRFKLPIGHRLSKHEGLCKNVHGHNIVCEIALVAYDLNDNDMVIDFKKVKEIMNPLLNSLDHCCLLNEDDFDDIKHLAKNNRKYITFNGDPTAEVLTEYIYNYISDKLPENIYAHSIRIWENDNSDIELIIGENI
jgi:6-pyruvoyltetrahydropterin/6-carboxytetrahydropterin synthase